MEEEARGQLDASKLGVGLRWVLLHLGGGSQSRTVPVRAVGAETGLSGLGGGGKNSTAMGLWRMAGLFHPEFCGRYMCKCLLGQVNSC